MFTLAKARTSAAVWGLQMILALDPGLHNCGVSLWTDTGLLSRAELVKNTVHLSGPLNAGPMAQAVVMWAASWAPGKVTELVIEVPQVYARERSKGDPNDLIDLACVVGGCMAIIAAEKTTQYKPAQWKGQVPKEICHARAMARLDDGEKRRIIVCQPASLHHNTLDAVALGLAHLTKTGRRK
jgi:hypothetical protein